MTVFKGEMVNHNRSSVWTRKDIIILSAMAICLTIGLNVRETDKNKVSLQPPDSDQIDRVNRELIEAKTKQNGETDEVHLAPDQSDMKTHDETKAVNDQTKLKEENEAEVGDKRSNIPSKSQSGKSYLSQLFPNIKYPPFQPNVTEDFPTSDEYQRIPHNLHQAFPTHMVPGEYSHLAKRLVDHNPSWKYYFWTEQSSLKLISDRYPYLLELWKAFSNHRRYIIRYVVIHEFGGAYIDPDVDTLRSLDRVTMKYACVIPTESFELSVFVHTSPFRLTNTILFCKARHPLFRQLLDNVYDALMTDQGPSENGAAAHIGPDLITNIYIGYINIDPRDENRTKTDFSSSSPYFYRGDMCETEVYGVYIPNTQYFTGEMALNDIRVYYESICKNYDNQPFLTKRACLEIQTRGIVRKEKAFKFLTHTWTKVANAPNSTNVREVDIRDVIANCVVYGEDESRRVNVTLNN